MLSAQELAVAPEAAASKQLRLSLHLRLLLLRHPLHLRLLLRHPLHLLPLSVLFPLLVLHLLMLLLLLLLLLPLLLLLLPTRPVHLLAQTRHDLLRRASRLPRPFEQLLRREVRRRLRRSRLPIRPLAPVRPPELPCAFRRLL